jgi:hypothetical protein
VWRTVFDADVRFPAFSDFKGTFVLTATGCPPRRSELEAAVLRRPEWIFFSWRFPATAILSSCDAVGMMRTLPTSASTEEADEFKDVMLLTGVL